MGCKILLVPEHALVYQEDSFHMLERRSMKLPRVASSGNGCHRCCLHVLLLCASVPDRRTALEIRVIKELLQDLAGELRWVSSERQWADGPTKTSSRQLLANRLRHGRLGFDWNPQYVAAKRKPSQERQANMDQDAEPPPQRSQVINEDVMGENELGDDIEMEGSSEQQAETGKPATASGDAYMVHTTRRVFQRRPA